MRRSLRARAAAVLPLLLSLTALAGCDGVQSAIDPAGPGAARIAALWWTMLALTGAAWLAIVGVLGFALLHRRHANEQAHHEERARTRGRAIGAATGASVVLLAVILAHTMLVERANARETRGDALVIDVVGHQWWWDVYYRDPVPARHARTSNELHLPVGRTVELRVRAADVIHSLWIPNLHGKIDLLPGRTNTLRLRPSRAGVYRGQCAEFCGLQHAHMALDVIVHEEPDFTRWLERQREPAAAPPDPLAARGLEVFLGTSCALCHEVRGTVAGATVGPDLTHLAGRRTLAAGMLPNVRGNLAGWILDPQRIKPGTLMPATNLSAADLHALLHYLETLQ